MTRSRPHARRSALADWTRLEPSAGDVGLLMASPLATMCVAGCAYHVVHGFLLLYTRIGPFGLRYSPYLTLLPSCAFCACYGATLGRNGLLAVTVGLFTAFVASLNCRGSFYWPGTFSMAHTGPLHTVLPLILGYVLGLSLALSPFRKPSLGAFRGVCAAMIGLALVWTLVDSRRDLGMDTLAPYSLHYALIAAYVGAAAAALLVRFAER